MHYDCRKMAEEAPETQHMARPDDYDGVASSTESQSSDRANIEMRKKFETRKPPRIEDDDKALALRLRL